MRNPVIPASGEFVFQDTWGKDYYGTSRDIGPGHGDGTSGSEIGAFNAPKTLRIEQGYLFVLDSGNHRIQKFYLLGAPKPFSDQTAEGVTLNCLGSEGYKTNQFVDPSDLCVSFIAGDIFVADRENFCVQVFDMTGKAIKTLARILNGRPAATNAPGGFFRPTAVAVNPFRELFVLDTGKSTVDKFLNSLNIDASWGTGGSLYNPAFASAVDIEGNDNNFWIYVLCRTKILKFGDSGNLVEEMDLAGFGPDRLANASRLAISADMLIITDGNYVKFFDFDGHFLYSIGGLSGDRDGEFNSPDGAYLFDDRLYVADTGNNRIQLFERR